MTAYYRNDFNDDSTINLLCLLT